METYTPRGRRLSRGNSASVRAHGLASSRLPAPDDAQALPSGARRGATATLFLTVLLDLLGFGMVVPFLPRMARGLGATDLEAGLITASYSLMQLVFVPVWGRLSDRIGRRPVLLGSIAATSVFMASLAFADGLGMLVASRLFAGIATANIAVAQACMADVTAPRERARGMGLIGAAFGIGFVVGPFVGGHLAAALLWGRESSAPALAASALSLVNLGMALVFLRESLPKEARASGVARARPSVLRPRELLSALRTSALILPLSVSFVAVASFAGLETTFTLLTLDAFGMTTRQAGNVFAAIGVTGVVVQGALIRPLSRRLGEARLLAIGVLVQAISFALMTLTPRLGVASLYGACLLLATGHGLTTPSLSSYVSRIGRHDARGETLGLLQSSGAFARVFGPVVGGALYASVSHVAPYAASACGMLVAFLLALRLEPLDPEHR